MESTMKQYSVYVVEDDISLSLAMDRVLKSIDNQIKLAWSGSAEEAMQTIQDAKSRKESKPFDMIVADVFLDGSKNGFDLWRLCNREYPNIPVILTSSTHFDSLSDVSSGYSVAPIFLQKPFTANDCKKVFKRALNILVC